MTPQQPATIALLNRLGMIRPNGRGWMARCPAHEDRVASLKIDEGDDRVLLHCHAGCRVEDVVGAMGASMADLFYEPSERSAVRREVAAYPYTDAERRLLYQVVRFEPKDFRQRRPDGSGGWLWSLNGVERVLYRLPELAAADDGELCFVVEGEKDADALARLGLLATTNPGGAGKWRDEYGQTLRRLNVVTIPDNDDTGRQHAHDVARRVGGRVLELPNLSPKGDVSEWLAMGGTRDQLVELVDSLSADPPAVIDAAFPEPEDRGTATLSALGGIEYVEDLIRPGRIVVWAAEEGSGKSFAVDAELGIRVAAAGGLFAGTWSVLRTGTVVYLSEMHADDDYGYESTVLSSLGLERGALVGRYYRLPLMTAAGGRPVLTVAEWRAWVTTWLRDRDGILLIVDTATGATQVDPWGREIQAVYRDLRVMLAEYPALAIVLVVHVRKPSGHGERRLSDVLGEWGRWCDVVVLQENDGGSLERAKLSVRKRVRHERRIVVTKAGGLLVDPHDVGSAGPKVPADDVVAAVVRSPGITYRELGKTLGVSKDTAANYVKAIGDRLEPRPEGERGTMHVYLTAEPPNTTEQARFGSPSVVPAVDEADDRRTAEPPYIDRRSASAVGGRTAPVDLRDEARRIYGADLAEPGQAP